MKQNISKLLIILVIHLYLPLAFAQSALNVNIDSNLNLDSEIQEAAISNPRSLEVWDQSDPDPPFVPDPSGPGGGDTPVGPSPGYTASETTRTAPPSSSSGGSGGMGAAGAVIGASVGVAGGGGLLALLLTRGGNSVSLPPISNQINPQLAKINAQNNSAYSFQFGEEILYYLLFKNTSRTPIYKDTVLYVKIPVWMEYIDSSTNINNYKLSDDADDDIFTYYKDDSLIVINLGQLKDMDEISLNFGAKVLSRNISKNEAFCQVKFQSINNKYETDWYKMSILPENNLPPVLNKVLKSQ